MRFRPCIDIHNGKVKQIVGGSLTDVQDQAKENFVSEQDAAFYAELYKKAGIVGGHVILLNSQDSPNYEATKQQALLALRTYPGGLQIGGGVNPGNAQEYLEAGASHVIVTSYVFKDGKISWEKLEEMEQAAGKEHLVLDLSCRKKDDQYFIVTDRWQKFTDVPVTLEIMGKLGEYCDEFLVHAVDVEAESARRRNRTGRTSQWLYRTSGYLRRRGRFHERYRRSQNLWRKPPGCNGRKRFGSLWRKYSLYRTCQIKVILQELTLYF